jgi:hypothetical protein
MTTYQRKDVWSVPEEEKLLEIVGQVGASNWKAVETKLKEAGYTRSSNGVQAHWRLLKARADALDGTSILTFSFLLGF